MTCYGVCPTSGRTSLGHSYRWLLAIGQVTGGLFKPHHPGGLHPRLLRSQCPREVMTPPMLSCLPFMSLHRMHRVMIHPLHGILLLRHHLPSSGLSKSPGVQSFHHHPPPSTLNEILNPDLQNQHLPLTRCQKSFCSLPQIRKMISWCSKGSQAYMCGQFFCWCCFQVVLVPKCIFS